MAKAPHFGGELFSIDSGTFAGVMPNSEQLGGDGTDAGTGKTAAREIKMGPLRESGGALLCKEGWNCR